MMTKTCKQCSGQFSIEDIDNQFYQKVQAPLPKNCPHCRLQRRLAFRNERALFPDECDKCHKVIISLYEPKSNLTVYCQSCWWGDDWSACDYGQDIDWSRSLLEQYLEVRKRVPRLSLGNMTSENSDYTNLSADNN